MVTWACFLKRAFGLDGLVLDDSVADDLEGFGMK